MKFNIPAEFKNASGVYIIRNSVNDKVYVGSTVDFRRRYYTHSHSFSQGKHNSLKFQNFVNKHGIGVLLFELLEIVNGSYKDLRSAEQKWLDLYGAATKNGFNILSTIAGAEQPLCRRRYVCAHCKSEFVSASANRKYCSSPCSHAGASARMKGKPVPAAWKTPSAPKKEYTCPCCNNIFTDYISVSRLFCSRSCARRSQIVSLEARQKISLATKGRLISEVSKEKIRKANSVERVNVCCSQCNSVFNALASENRRFCDVACANTFRKGIPLSFEVRQKLSKPLIECECEHCKNIFLARPSKPRKFCSKSCSSTSRYSKLGKTNF